MKWRRGPRPWAVRVFALAFLAAAAFRLVEGLINLETSAWRLADWMGSLVQSQDAVIVGLFIEFTIALIPIIWIYGIGSRVARWFVLAFGLYKLLGFRMLYTITTMLGPISWWAYIEPVLIIIALTMLLSPSLGEYLKSPEKEVEPETFA